MVDSLCVLQKEHRVLVSIPIFKTLIFVRIESWIILQTQILAFGMALIFQNSLQYLLYDVVVDDDASFGLESW